MTTFLHRFTVKPRHEERWLPLWRRAVSLRADHGFVTHAAYQETDAEPKITWLYSHDDPDAGIAELEADPRMTDLVEKTAPHVFGNTLVRPVRVELPPREADGRTVIMRRYRIVGEWDAFLDVWRRIVPVRERHGFGCLFAVEDRDDHMFTWAFAFEGDWADFPEAQRGYYADPQRVELRGVFDFMADYSIHPAVRLA